MQMLAESGSVDWHVLQMRKLSTDLPINWAASYFKRYFGCSDELRKRLGGLDERVHLRFVNVHAMKHGSPARKVKPEAELRFSLRKHNAHNRGVKSVDSPWGEDCDE